jgi:hypothetical protein
MGAKDIQEEGKKNEGRYMEWPTRRKSNKTKNNPFQAIVWWIF